jgi:hypothetical protein
MDPRLKGSVIPGPALVKALLPEELAKQEGFETFQTFHPGMGVLCNLDSAPADDLWLDHKYRIKQVLSQHSQTSSGPVSLRIERNTQESGVEVQDLSGFRKVTHLLDPVRWLHGKYSLPKHSSLPWHQESWESAWKKLHDPMNQAYVEAVATYAFSRLREADVSPHFHLYYGSLCARAQTYSYNITDSYMSYRNYSWFWNGLEKDVFKVGFDQDIPDDVRKAILEQPTNLQDSSDSEASSQTEELDGLDCEKAEIGSLHSADGSEFQVASESESESNTTPEEDESDATSESEELDIFADIKSFPVMLMYMEASEGTMDDLLDDFEEVGAEPGTQKWELIWKAWIFQVIAALCVGQNVFGFTHNDLHTNNVVWSKTSEKFLHYKMRDGTLFKVPTFGRIFRLIDFGRSIFRINEHMFYSDDFCKGNDAAEQYNFGPLLSESEEEVYPNPSFDLSRFAVGIFESLFPEQPPLKKNAKILSEEPDLVVRETQSDLYNTMWSWLLADDGHNVLMDPDGSERYPDFDLYKVIAAQVHNAVPSDQIKKSVFSCFRVPKYEGKTYSLFC